MISPTQLQASAQDHSDVVQIDQISCVLPDTAKSLDLQLLQAAEAQDAHSLSRVPSEDTNASSTDQTVTTNETGSATMPQEMVSSAGSVNTSITEHEQAIGFEPLLKEDEPMLVDSQEADAEIITDVWASNFEVELAKIQSLILDNEKTYISFDTEFAGFLRFGPESMYEQVRQNVSSLKLIQLGVTLANQDKQMPSPVATWQFNFMFDKTSDQFQSEAIHVLENAGIDFKRHAKEGIRHLDFSHLFVKSNLVCNPQVIWLAFNARYDYGYLLHLFQDQAPLPFNEDDFLRKCSSAFNTFYDVKLLRDDRGSLHQQLELEQIALPQQAHQAGSDCLSTIKLFFKTIDNLEKKGRQRDITANCILGLQESGNFEYGGGMSRGSGRNPLRQQDLYDLIRGYQDKLHQYKQDVYLSKSRQRRQKECTKAKRHTPQQLQQYPTESRSCHTLNFGNNTHGRQQVYTQNGAGYQTSNNSLEYCQQAPQSHTVGFANLNQQQHFQMMQQERSVRPAQNPQQRAQTTGAPHQGHRPIYNYQMPPQSAENEMDFNPQMRLTSECFYPTPVQQEPQPQPMQQYFGRPNNTGYSQQSNFSNSYSQGFSQHHNGSSQQNSQSTAESNLQNHSGFFEYDSHSSNSNQYANQVAWKHMRSSPQQHQQQPMTYQPKQLQQQLFQHQQNQQSSFMRMTYHRPPQIHNHFRQNGLVSSNSGGSGGSHKNGFIVDDQNRLVRVRDY